MTKDIQFNYEGRIVVVTGGSKGIGMQVVKDFLLSGASVYYVSRSANKEISSLGAIHLQCDLRSESQIYSAFEKLETIDILINCAAINFCKRIEDIDTKEWDNVLDVNLRSYYLTCKLALEKMKQKKFGKIVNVSSIAGRNKSLVSGVHYTSSKSGIIGLTKQLALESGPFGINVNVTCPSQTLTDMLKNSMTKQQLDNLSQSIPIRKIATTSQQSQPILFLCSEAASYITGCALDVNGGQL